MAIKKTAGQTEGNGDNNSGGGFLKNLNNMGSWGAMAGDTISGFGSAIGNKYGEDFSEDQKSAQSAIRSGLAKIPGYGQLIAAATGVVDAIGTATGTNLSNVNKDSAKKFGLSGAAGFNNAMNMLPGNSMIWGGIGAAFGGGRSHSFSMSDEAAEMMGGYAGTVSDLQAAEDIAGKNWFGRWNRRKANRAIDQAKEQDRILADIGRTNTMRKQSDYYQDVQNQNINRYAGQNYLGMTVGKNGMKLMSIEEARRIIALRKEENPEKFQNGGNIPGIDTSLLPEGSLHAHKNHLEELNPDLEDATKKGIPVMAAEGGEIQDQVAEVEQNELVFRLEITKQLEELMKDGSEEAMIEAGRIATQEIIENTTDNTGQITEEVKNGKE